MLTNTYIKKYKNKKSPGAMFETILTKPQFRVYKFLLNSLEKR